MPQPPLDLSRVFRLEPHGPDTWLGESPAYAWGRIYGGLVLAQALWAATQTVRSEHVVHSLHAYFILGGELGEPVRYEVDRVRNGRSFSTRRVVARQSAGAILTLGCSFQKREDGPEAPAVPFPSDVPPPGGLASQWDAGLERRDVVVPARPPRSAVWVRFPEPLGEDPRLSACALAYLSDTSPMDAVAASRPGGRPSEGEWDQNVMGVSLDHAMWFHRDCRADDWVLIDLAGHGLFRTRGLATGAVFRRDGAQVATVAQECLLRERRAGQA
ncbi:MAG: thioesterase family protein [Myxococcota bacterium]|nr:thioesterase family protein [Myxococcota bacterium]